MSYFLTLIPSVFALLTQTVVALDAPTFPDRNGIYRFTARSGETLALEREISPGNPKLCYPELISGGQVKPFTNSVKQTPYHESLLVKIEESGTYEYQIFSVPSIDLSAPEREIAQRYIPPDGHWCKVTVRLAEEYEKVWAEADLAYKEGDLERSLFLYRRAIALEPNYPEPYKRAASISLAIYRKNSNLKSTANLDDIGQFYLSMPESLKQPVLDYIEQLARIYEASPNWQIEAIDRPDFLRDWASYIRTGIPSERVKEILAP
ncbi:hypothetical protein [Oscillatoria sp. FACHB-1406]|uniref:hypothetical protein n=1 Tax=Oscillatoria sp. FACHB-1406 TaxID=2692846 RepID=UPI00168527D1|nr:hypothetical protein [Oscillatoria sp. FACHB-1406]MBD2577056.1 hypothetical protein [Oscillatoria sp. FACHB-1406]